MKRLFLAMALCLIASSVMATDWYVRPSGGDYGTENGTSYPNAWDGFSNIVWDTGGVVAGDTLYVYGTHYESLDVGASGTSSDFITVDCSNAILDGSLHEDNSSFTLDSGNVYALTRALATYTEPMIWEDDEFLAEVADKTAVESTMGSYWFDTETGIYYVHSSDNSSPITNGKQYATPKLHHNFCDAANNYIYLTGGEFRNVFSDDDHTVGGVDIRGDYCVIANIYSHHHRRHAFSFYLSASNSKVLNSLFAEVEHSYNIAIYNASSCSVSNCTVTGHKGIIVHGTSKNNIISNNNITVDIDAAIVFEDDAGVGYGYTTVSDNKIIVGADYGARVYSEGNIFKNNLWDLTLTSGSRYGVFNDGNDNSYINNTFYSAGMSSVIAALRAYTGTGVLFKNNIFINLQRGIRINSGASGTISDYNSFYNCTHIGRWTDDADYTTLAQWQAASSQDANSIDTDPLLNSSYKLAKDSPCIGAGVYVPGVTDASDSASYFLPSIGAYEARTKLFFAKDATGATIKNGTSSYPYSALSEYIFTGNNARAGGIIRLKKAATNYGTLDLSGLTDTGAIAVEVEKGARLTGFVTNGDGYVVGLGYGSSGLTLGLRLMQ